MARVELILFILNEDRGLERGEGTVAETISGRMCIKILFFFLIISFYRVNAPVCSQ